MGIDKLLITFENAKLKGIWHYSLPSGWTCPGALNCLTKTDRETGKVTDKQTPDADGVTYRCYAAGMEGTYPSVRKARWDNLDKLARAKTEDLWKSLLDHARFKAVLVKPLSGGTGRDILLKMWIADTTSDITTFC